MCSKNLLLWMCIIASLSLSTVSCSDTTDPLLPPGIETDPEVYFDIETNPVSFECNENKAVRIAVRSSEAWSVTSSAEWIVVEKSAEQDAVLVMAKRNRTVNARDGKITVENVLGERAEISVNQLEATAQVLEVIVGDKKAVAPRGMSLNGRYISGNHGHTAFRCDIDAHLDKGYLEMDELFYGENARSVSNDGRTSHWGITPNGRIKTGMEYVSNEIRASFQGAYIIKDGVKKYLPYPARDVYGTANYQGNVPLNISADGKFILCRNVAGGVGTWHDACWRLNESTGEYEFHFWDKNQAIDVGGVAGYASPHGMSYYGKYTFGNYGLSDIDQPYYRDNETGKITILFDFPGYEPGAITDDGILFMAKANTFGTAARTTYVYDIKTGEATEFKKWCEEKYGITTFMGASQTVMAASNDLSRIVWYDSPDVSTYYTFVLTVD